MRRWVPAAAAAIALMLLAGFVARWVLAERYQFAIRVEPTGDPSWPCVATGSITGRGLDRLDGTVRFGLKPRPGGVARMMGSTRRDRTVEVYAGLSRDTRVAWYIATVIDHDLVIASQSGVVALPHDGRHAADARAKRLTSTSSSGFIDSHSALCFRLFFSPS